MAEPLRIDVATPSRPYGIWVGAGLLRQLPDLLGQAGVGPRLFVVSADPVWKHWGPALRNALPTIEPIFVPDGERFKALAQVSAIYDTLYHAGADRRSAILTLGGGVVGDMAGFAAATYLRGLPLVHVPTTLLAQVDSSIGGKVGVNLPGGKNLVGAFYQPCLVVSDPEVLSTLPRREFRAGLYEVLKYGMACDHTVFEALSRDLQAIGQRNPDVLVPLVASCCRIKASIVARDERESGLREVLNFGHTAGHAFEALTRYQRFLHGEAVAHGMRVAAQLAAARGLLSAKDQAELGRLIAQLGPLPTVSDLATHAVVGQMRHDKKARHDRIRFILPTGIGSSVTADDVTDDELTTALRRCGVDG